jgi:hypothetical protein
MSDQDFLQYGLGILVMVLVANFLSFFILPTIMQFILKFKQNPKAKS